MKEFRKICEEGVQSYAPDERQEYRADFSLNENPLGCSEDVMEAIRNVKEHEVADYQPLRKSLVEKIAGYEGVDIENIVVSAGSDKCMQTIANSLFKKDTTVAYPTPSFPRYSFYVRLMDAEPEEVAYELFQGREPGEILQGAKDADFLILDNPSNPTGYRFTDDELEEIVDGFDGHVIIDAALDNGNIDAARFVRDDVFLVKSFSKYFGMSGLRIGYIITAKRNASMLDSVVSPFEVDIVAQRAAEAALGDIDYLRESESYIQRERKRLKQGLGELDVRHTDSDSTNMVVEIKEEVQDRLEQRGINLTRGSDYKGLPSDTVRIGVRTEEENELLLSELQAIKEESE